MRTHTVEVSEADAGKRLDKFLSEAIPALSRARVQQLLADGHIQRSGVSVTNGAAKTKTGECYTLHEPEIAAMQLTPEAIALDIVFEDAHLLVINKPAGMTVHPAPGQYTGTLVHALLAHCGESLSGIGGVARPGIVHRIDKDTSGLLVVAKHDAAHQHLSAQLKNRSLSRAYIAYGWGAPRALQGTIDAPMARHPRKRKEMAVVGGGKPAVTHYTITAQFGHFASRFACQLETGRTHQIRVHLAHLGCGIIGDPVYGMPTRQRLTRLKAGGTEIPAETERFLLSFNRQALHATKLKLIHPFSGEAMGFEAALPADLLALEAQLCALT